MCADEAEGRLELLEDQVAAMLFFQIDDEAALVPIKHQEARIDAVLARPSDATGRITFRRLDFDHVGAHIAEQHRAKRPRNNLGQIQNMKSRQWSFRHLFHRPSMRRRSDVAALLSRLVTLSSARVHSLKFGAANL